jgi:hypothetical protein
MGSVVSALGAGCYISSDTPLFPHVSYPQT